MLSRGLLEWDLGQLADALKLTPEEVRTYFTDGRRVSFVLERRLAREVPMGTLAPSEGAGYDLMTLPAASGKSVRSRGEGSIFARATWWDRDVVLMSRDFSASWTRSLVTWFPIFLCSPRSHTGLSKPRLFAIGGTRDCWGLQLRSPETEPLLFCRRHCE